MDLSIEETLQLNAQFAESGELEALTPERVWKETSRALMEDHADEYFQVLRRLWCFKSFFLKSMHFWYSTTP
jgi:tRNA nucleotidyltransferase (CCA-adding enzyme)